MKFIQHPNITHTKNHLGRQGLKKPLRPSLVILQFSKTLLKAKVIVFLTFKTTHFSILLLYKMNFWWQFNLVNQSFLSDWQILYW